MVLEKEIYNVDQIGRTFLNTATKGSVIIDTCYTFDGKWESGVFRVKSGTETVRNWIALEIVRYKNKEEAQIGHDDLIEKWIHM